MTDKTPNKQDILAMEGELTHDELMVELDRINNKQMALVEK